MTRREIAHRLRAAGIEDAETEAGLLFSHFSGMSRAAMLCEPHADCADPALETAVARRECREPLAYILGEAWFFTERYEVTPDCLIPRPETEMLVEYACAHLPPAAKFADFCTGSGCIAISVLAHRPDCRADAYDLSPATLSVAKRNAEANGVADRLTFFEKNLLITAPVCCETKYEMIISNPPYVVAEEIDGLAPEISHEPRMAFDGGADGFDFYSCFLAFYGDLLTEDGCFVFEIGADQREGLMNLAAREGYTCDVTRDLAGRDRMAVLRRRG